MGAGEGAEVLAVEEEENEGGEGEAEEVEEERGDVGERGFDQGEGGSPEEGYGDEEEVGQEFGADWGLLPRREIGWSNATASTKTTANTGILASPE